ncbi:MULTISPECIES: coniferyl aldehyde dehydrogenase [Serratia]|uniref:coniferyl aldehyde dehydrogenase n=2 Tax=Serratia TaxID=613 RepID=UPI000745585E|nr:coniferyl aldehyde dehydrogenase [Serratia marcescens]MCF1217370.1 coniferyl aldehyde dehydrogenase [Serratia marcescens]MCF1319894.1 coniferyl aldehyde dehydrogenase [Serratia marcescens]MCF1324648.1 coniferyl aldehyde dehydrogenase [Serratia marcescens]MCS3412336.1 coniferyl aldehyde dehydrogenase [Serratia marcescens]MDV5426531.1 coniferyl aldehyde dehydrogenase [Serratia marcescens]
MQGDDILMTMEQRLAAQRHAFLRDGAPTIAQRKAALRRLRSAILAQRGALTAAVSADFGHRSPYETEILEILVTVQAIDYLLRNLKRFMQPERRHVALPYQAGRAYVQYQPKGVIGVMAPWNYPFSLTFIPLATALAAGNRVMLKPSELTPHTSQLIETMLAALFPADEVAVVTGGPDVGAGFSELAFDHLVFTGSTAIGRQIMQAAGKNLVPLTLELGGKSPAVVAPGAVNARTVNSLAFGKLSNAGQTCIAPDFLLIHQDDVENFIALYDAAVKAFYPDGPTSHDYGAIINDRHYHRLQDLLTDAQARGARIVPVGHRPDSAVERPKTLAPTLIVGAPDDSRIMQEEIFGPLLPIRTYAAFDEAIDVINAGPRPLALYYFGPGGALQDRLLARTTSGNVSVNATLLHFAQDDLPFGGIGPSGMGAYHGVEGFRALSHAKGVFIQSRWRFTDLLRAPFGRLADAVLKVMLRRR